MGRHLVPVLLAHGYRVRVLVRAASIARVPEGAVPFVGDALDGGSFAGALRPGETLVHLVGTPHPSPAKAVQFRSVDLPSIRASVAAATQARVAHLVYVSVAHPAPVMKAYIAVRSEGEAAIARAGLTATVLRPWYVVGPGHRWPLLLVPIYMCMEALPVTRESAERLGLVTIRQMIRALAHAVGDPPPPGTTRILDVAAIRRAPIAAT